MTSPAESLPECLRHSPVQIAFGAGAMNCLGELASAEAIKRILLVTDPGIAAAGHVARAVDILKDAGIAVHVFDGVAENPTTDHVAAGLKVAQQHKVDSFLGLGGGSSLDCAKGINLLYTNGGRIADYWGVGKTHAALKPMIAVPTTAGTGSEGQSFALITDPETHQKMACGDRRMPWEGGLRPRVAILDPDLTRTQPFETAAASGIDAVSHAIETAATFVRNETSLELSCEAWRRLDRSFDSALANPADDSARADMLLGAHLAGVAIEHSMLGAAHACANPLTARFGITHGVAVGVMLPAVMRFNDQYGSQPYAPLSEDIEALIDRVRSMLAVAGLPGNLSELLRDRDIEEAIPELAVMAGEQWTARFNTVVVGVRDLATIYRMSLDGGKNKED